MKLMLSFTASASVASIVLGLTACSSDQSASRSPDSGSGGAVGPARTGGATSSGARGGAGGTAGPSGSSGGRHDMSGGARGVGKDATAPDADSDGQAAVPYQCVGGEVARTVVDATAIDAATIDPGSLIIVPWTQSVGTCEAGKTYCSIASSRLNPDVPPTRSCEPVPAACRATPSCTCLCSHGLPCEYVNCKCKDDADGRAIWACEQI